MYQSFMKDLGDVKLSLSLIGPGEYDKAIRLLRKARKGPQAERLDTKHTLSYR